MLQHYFSYHGQETTKTEPPQPIPLEYLATAAAAAASTPAPVLTRPFRILELGAGTGYVGIYLANILRHPCSVYITDLTQVLPLIRDNVAAHHKPDTATIHVEPLHWGNKEHADRLLADAGGEFDLVVVSDCVYFPELFSLLTQTLEHVCSPKTKIVIGYKCRSLEKECGFWQDYFGRIFNYEPVRKVDKQGNVVGLLGEEEQIFVFVGTRADHCKPADDKFTTLLFCNIGGF